MVGLRTDSNRENTTGQPQDQRYYGKFIGFVRDTSDPEERGRVRFYCPEVMGDRDHAESWTPWALPCFEMGGGYNTGKMAVPPMPADSLQGSSSSSALRQWACWIEFRHGDPRFPIYVGGFYVKDTDLPGFTPKLASEKTTIGEPSLEPPVGQATVRVRPLVVEDGAATLGTASTGSEPPPAADPLYPHNRLYRSPSGHLQEMDDTPGEERIRMFHRGGTSWEMTPDGSLVTRVVGKTFAYISEDDIRNVCGPTLHIHEGEYQFQARRGVETVIEGERRTYVDKVEQYWNKAGYTRTIAGLWAVSAQNIEVESTEGIQLTAAGGMALGAGERIDIVSLRTAITAAVMASIGCPTGVVLHGTLPAESALEPIMGGTSFLAAATAAVATLAAPLGLYIGANPPIAAPIPNEAAMFVAIQASLAGLVAAISASFSIHRLTKV